MFKNPITNKGEIRYFEIIKIFFILAFFFGMLSKILAQIEFSSTVLGTTGWMLFVLYGLQLVVLLKEDYKFIIEMIRKKIHIWIDQPVVVTIAVPNRPYLKQEYIINNSNQYLHNNVIRC